MKYAVKDIRNNTITNEPIIYKWWFSKEITKVLLKALEPEVRYSKIKKTRTHCLLYIGKAKKGHDSLIDYYINDVYNCHEKDIMDLAALRQTICALMGWNMSMSRQFVNELMDKHCLVEWETCSAGELAEKEMELIRQHYLPLNYMNTVGILSPEHRRRLRTLKRKYHK